MTATARWSYEVLRFSFGDMSLEYSYDTGEKVSRRGQQTLLDIDGNRKYLNIRERKWFLAVAIRTDQSIMLFCLMLYWTGARISEVLQLRVRDIDFPDKVVKFKCLKKRGDIVWRQIPIPPIFLDMLQEYTATLMPYDRLWTWSRRTGSRYIKKVMQQAGICGIHACSKGLRHSFAIHCLDRYVPLPLIKKWMGHASITTTYIYLNVVGREERKYARRLWK